MNHGEGREAAAQGQDTSEAEKAFFREGDGRFAAGKTLEELEVPKQQVEGQTERGTRTPMDEFQYRLKSSQFFDRTKEWVEQQPLDENQKQEALARAKAELLKSNNWRLALSMQDTFGPVSTHMEGTEKQTLSDIGAYHAKKAFESKNFEEAKQIIEIHELSPEATHDLIKKQLRSWLEQSQDHEKPLELLRAFPVLAPAEVARIASEAAQAVETPSQASQRDGTYYSRELAAMIREKFVEPHEAR